MPRRSKIELSPETIAELEEQFYNFLHSLSPEETNKFFKEFLTTEEKMMMYKRLALYWSLFEGYSLASIQRMLGITHDTTRIYNKKKNEMSTDFKDLLHRIGRNENGQTINEDVSEEKEEKLDNTENEEKESEEKEEDKPVVVEAETEEIKETESNDVEPNEAQNEEKESEEKIEAEKAEHEEKNEEMKENIETQSEEKDENNENKNDEENEHPEKKKKGFGRFFGF